MRVDLAADIFIFLNIIHTGTFVVLSLIHAFEGRKRPNHKDYNPQVTVIVPAHNEEKTISNCVTSILSSDYPHFTLVVVDDGSTDQTYEVLNDLKKNHQSLQIHQVPHGGKASALNHGIRVSDGEIIVTIDADSVIRTDAISKLVAWFVDRKVGAVGGNVKVANRQKLLTIHQAGEYLSGLNLHRRAFAVLRALQIVPGAIGAFRRKALEAAGGYSNDTKVEDMDLTIAIQEQGYRALYDAEAITYTEVPHTLGSFMMQRHRWTYGSLRVVSKYRHLLFSRRSAFITIGLSYLVIYLLLQVVMSTLFVITVVGFTIGEFPIALAILLMTVAVHFSLGVYSTLIDRESARVVLSTAFLGVWYYHILSLVAVASLYSYIRQENERHIDLERVGGNSLGLVLAEA